MGSLIKRVLYAVVASRLQRQAYRRGGRGVLDAVLREASRRLAGSRGGHHPPGRRRPW